MTTVPRPLGEHPDLETHRMTGEARPYQRCTRTIMDTTDPDIWFDDEGVSSHAHYFDGKIAPVLLPAQRGERRGELEALVAEIKRSGEGKPYDCVIGISGGVDSTYLTLQAVKMGLRPLCVHFDSGWNSELAVHNIHSLVTTLGLDLHTHVIDWREMRDLQLSFFKASVPNCDIPTDHAFAWVSYDQAEKYGIKYILSGSNYVSESILPRAWGYDAADAKHLLGIQKRFGTVKLKTYPILGWFKRRLWYPSVKKIDSVALLNYMEYHYATAKAEIAAEVGWRDYGGKHYESVFTRYFQGYYLPHKFGFDKRLAHYSSLILAGEMTRDEALSLMEKPNYPEELRKQDHDFIAKKLGLTPAEFDEIIARPPVDDMEYPNSLASWARLEKVIGVVLRVLTAVGLRKRATA